MEQDIYKKHNSGLKSVDTTLLMQVPAAIAIVEGKDHVYRMVNPLYEKYYSKTSSELIGKTLKEAFPEIESQGIYDLFDSVFESGEVYIGYEFPASFMDNGKLKSAFYDFSLKPIKNEENEIYALMIFVVEVTEKVLSRKKAEEKEIALKLLNDEFNLSVSAGKIGTWNYDVKTNVIHWSKEQLEIYGLNEKEFKQTPEHFHSFLYNMNVEQLHSLAEKNLVEDEATYEFQIKRNDGKVRWIHSRSKLLKDKNGDLHSIHGINIDVTEQKEISEKVKESEIALRELSDAMPHVVWKADENGQVIYYNDRVAEFSGAKKNLNNQWEWEGLLHPDDLEATMEAWNLALKRGDKYEKDHRIKMADGTYRWHLSRGFPQKNYNGEVRCWYGTATDIHEQKALIEQLKNSESRLRTLAETLSQLVWVTDGRGGQQYASPRWKEYTGIQPSGAETWIEIIHPDDLSIISTAWSHSLSTGDKYNIELRLKNKEGAYRWFFGTGEAVKNEKGEIVNWIGSFTDIHKQKEFAEQLEILVKERTEQLIAKNNELESINKELESFNRVASHDLQEPLRKIQSFLNLLDLKCDDEKSKKNYLDKIHKSAARMSSLIRSIMEYNMIASHDKKYECVDLNTIIGEVMEDFELLITDKNAIIDFNNLVQLKAVPHEMRQLFSNLISNSLKFCERRPVINIKTEVEKNFIKIIYIDNGIGFSEEYKEKVFGLFQRLHTQSEYQGSGIGLSIVKKVVDNHHGKIEVESKLGEGTTFIITIPE